MTGDADVVADRRGRPPVIERLHPLQIEAYRRMTPAERLEAAFAMTDMLRDMITAQTRTSHPEWTDEEVGRAVADRFLLAAV